MAKCVKQAPAPTNKAEAVARGFTVDCTVYPWFAYKGPRFAPIIGHRILTDLEEKLRDTLQDASDHLDYVGYGDSWERSCAEESKLSDRIAATLKEAEDHAKNA